MSHAIEKAPAVASLGTINERVPVLNVVTDMLVLFNVQVIVHPAGRVVISCGVTGMFI